MDDALIGDQPTLLDATVRFVEQTYPLDAVRARSYFDDEDMAVRYERTAGELGWYSMVVPEDLGGGSVSGNGILDAALVAYERGRRLQPGPFVSTNVVARSLALSGTAAQRAEVLPTLMAGTRRATWAIVAPPGAPAMVGPLDATAVGDGYRVSGACTLVEDPRPDGVVLVTAATDRGPVQLLGADTMPGLTVRTTDALDVTRRFVELQFDAVEFSASSVLADDVEPVRLVREQLALASALVAADSAGAMDADFGAALDYAKHRIAFGRPIGSFQAIKHTLADASLDLEMSKAIARAAAERIGERDPNMLRVASIAKAFTGDRSIDLAQTCFQVFGGIGFTWEHDQHLYLRRLTMNAALFGDPTWHREWLCRLSGVSPGETSDDPRATP